MPAYTNAPQVIPHVFKEIIRNDIEREAVLDEKVIPFEKANSLIDERRRLTASAEKMLRWNTDKGNAAQ